MKRMVSRIAFFPFGCPYIFRKTRIVHTVCYNFYLGWCTDNKHNKSGFFPLFFLLGQGATMLQALQIQKGLRLGVWVEHFPKFNTKCNTNKRTEHSVLCPHCFYCTPYCNFKLCCKSHSLLHYLLQNALNDPDLHLQKKQVRYATFEQTFIVSCMPNYFHGVVLLCKELSQVKVCLLANHAPTKCRLLLLKMPCSRFRVWATPLSLLAQASVGLDWAGQVKCFFEFGTGSGLA